MISALLLGVALAGTGAPAWEPSTWPSPGEGVSATKAASVAPRRNGAMEAMYWAYRRASDQNGGGCPYFPTCSRYGIEAWRSWGFPVGVWLTVDRLLREYPGMAKQDDYPIITPHRMPRFADPVPARERARR